VISLTLRKNYSPLLFVLLQFCQLLVIGSAFTAILADGAFHEMGTRSIPSYKRTSEKDAVRSPSNLCILLLRDDAVDEAKKNGWVIISMKDDWKRIFKFEP
jgi:hypothetical protein